MASDWLKDRITVPIQSRIHRLGKQLGTFDPRHSLRARIAFTIASLTMTLSVILTIITGQISGQQLERNIGQTLADLSSSVVGQLDQMMYERWREIRITAFQATILAANDSTASVRALLDQLKETYHYYAWIGWADPSGTVIASTDGYLQGQNVASLPWFQQAQTSQMPYIGDIHEEPQFANLEPSLVPANQGGPKRFVNLAMPIRSVDGQLLGVLATYLDWRFMREQSDNIQHQFATQNGVILSAASPIDVFILGADGTVLIGPSAFTFPQITSLPKLTLSSLQAARTGQSGYVTETWADSSKTYLTGYARDNGYRGYPGMGWIVLTRERADIALASVSQLQALLLAIGMVFAVIFSGIGWLLAVQITRPLAHVAELARAIKTGDRNDRPTLPVGRADEVSVLSNTINRLLVSLNERNAQLTSLNANLERRIQERTAELAASQRFNENIVSTVPDMIYIYDVIQGRNLYVNQAASSLTGYNADELGTRFNHVSPEDIHPDDLKAYHANQESILRAADGELIEQVFRFKHRDGHWVWVHCRETVFARDADGRVTQAFGVAQDITLRKQAEAELQETAAAQERQRLARELHDSVSQTLFSATMVAQTLPLLWDKGEVVVKKNLDVLSRLTRGALAEMRTLLNELRPAAIETADLAELITHLTDAARGRTPAECTFTVEGEGSLPPDVQVAAYRVAQEALNNVTKHARARHIEVTLKRGAGMIEMRVKDDGRGFQENRSLSDHFGLGIMHERAQEVGAHVEIHSQPGHGTEVVFTWYATETTPERVDEVSA